MVRFDEEGLPYGADVVASGLYIYKLQSAGFILSNSISSLSTSHKKFPSKVRPPGLDEFDSSIFSAVKR